MLYMTRTDLPLLHLAEPPTRQRTASRIHLGDAIFLTGSLILLLGGTFFLLDLGAARSAGHDTSLHQFLSSASEWQPAVPGPEGWPHDEPPGLSLHADAQGSQCAPRPRCSCP